MQQPGTLNVISPSASESAAMSFLAVLADQQKFAAKLKELEAAREKANAAIEEANKRIRVVGRIDNIERLEAEAEQTLATAKIAADKLIADATQLADAKKTSLDERERQMDLRARELTGHEEALEEREHGFETTQSRAIRMIEEAEKTMAHAKALQADLDRKRAVLEATAQQLSQ